MDSESETDIPVVTLLARQKRSISRFPPQQATPFNVEEDGIRLNPTHRRVTMASGKMVFTRPEAGGPLVVN